MDADLNSSPGFAGRQGCRHPAVVARAVVPVDAINGDVAAVWRGVAHVPALCCRLASWGEALPTLRTQHMMQARGG